MTTFLNKDIQLYNDDQLDALCEELRSFIYATVLECGGHLSSNLGAIESTVALFRVFDFPNDKIVFDVGHQCYAYKLLSGRVEKFSTLRQKDGLAGFPKRKESVYDSYDTGHAGNSISAALGLAKARDLRGETHNVIAYIGDGAFNNGLVYEALNSLKILNTKILIILNDNDMSISQTVGGMHDLLGEAKHEKPAEQSRVLESFGLTYLGVRNGNNVYEMVEALQEAKSKLAESSVLLHISTTKGKGYTFCEEYPTNTHGISPQKSLSSFEYSEVLGDTLCALAEKNDKISVVTAAMKEPLGLTGFFNRFPERAFDVGICEEHAAVLCAGMAIGGMKPYYAVYSTFLQRAFDEVIHDVCAQDLPVTFCIDRAGIVGADGETHQGVFDLSYLTLIPNLTIVIPKDREEFSRILEWSATYSHPLAIRYPRAGNTIFRTDNSPIEVGKWEYLHKDINAGATVLACGERCIAMAMEASKSMPLNVVNARFCKPLDTEMLRGISTKHLITMEDNVYIGGFGAFVNAYVVAENLPFRVKNFAYNDEFIPQGNIVNLQEEYGVSVSALLAYLKEIQ